MLPPAAACCVCVGDVGSLLAASLPLLEMNSLQNKANTGLTQVQFSSRGSC